MEPYHLKMRRSRVRTARTRMVSGLVLASPIIGLVASFILLQPQGWLETGLAIVFLGAVPISVIVSIRLDKYEEERFIFRIKLSKFEADLFEKWKKSGSLTTVIKSVSANQITRLTLASQKEFGKYVAKSRVRPNGKTWETKLPRVGVRFVEAGYSDGSPRYDAILFRRDIASAQKIRRPWRRASGREREVQLTHPYRSVQLPDWIQTG